MKPLTQFARELRRREPAVDILALAIAGIEYPEVDVKECLEQIDTLAAFVGQGLEAQQMGEDRAAYFLHAVHNELGFAGNQQDYYDPDNSYLNQVLACRTGLPILLSVLCMAMGRRLRIQIDGIGFPGHFMVQYRDAQGAWLLDIFHGKMLPVIEADDYLSRLFNRPISLPLDVFEPVSVESVATRILNNLRGVYLNRGDHAKAAKVMDYLVVLSPDNPAFWQERGLLHQQNGHWEESARDLRRYFFLSGHLAALVRAANQPDAIPEEMTQQDRYLLSVLEQVEQIRARLN